jgi:hypothetical protein
MKHEKPFRTRLIIGLARLALGASVASPVAMACGGQSDEEQRIGSETHFLTRCSDECGAGLECLGNVCTTACTADETCTGLSTAAACVPAPGGTTPAVCDVACTATSDCDVLSSAHRCEDGFCRAAALEGIGSLSAGFSRMELRRIGEEPAGAGSLCDPQVFVASIAVEPSTHLLLWSYCDRVRGTDTFVPSQGVMPLGDPDIDTVLSAMRELRLSADATCTPEAGILTLDVTTMDGAQESYTDRDLAGCRNPAFTDRRFVDDLTDLYDTLRTIQNP